MNDNVSALIDNPAVETPEPPAGTQNRCPMRALTAEHVQPDSAPDKPLDAAAGVVAANRKSGGGLNGFTALPLRDEETSKHLAGTTELTVIADIKPGLINVREPTSYATRLRILLRTLNAIRKKGAEKAEDSVFVGPIESLQTIHHVRWTIFDDEQKMLLAVVFDRPLESYIRRLVDHAGPVLNAILCHCKDYEGDKGYTAFTDFVRKNQAPIEFLGSSVTGLTVDDQQYLKALEQLQRSAPDRDAFDLAAARLRVKDSLTAAEESVDEAFNAGSEQSNRQALRVIQAMHRLDEFFPESTDADPDVAKIERRDRTFFHTMVKAALPQFESQWVPDCDPLRQRYKHELDWFEKNIEDVTDKELPQTKPAKQASADALQKDVQGNILTGYKHMTHGCLLLMRLGEPEAAHNFVQSLKSKVTTHNANGDIALNFALTYHGLKTLGLPEAELAKFPKEFREGMEARAGLLGDMGPNHPTNWNLPATNWPVEANGNKSGDTVHLSTVDLVIQLQKANVNLEHDKWLWSVNHPLYLKVKGLAEEAEKTGAQLLSVQPLRRKLIGGKVREHFGFRDGLSQPTPDAEQRDRNGVPLGELLLGYENAHGDSAPAKDSILHNGTFLVLRKLSQNVEAFERFLDKSDNCIGRETLEAKMVGRDKYGIPIVDKSITDPDVNNDFDYENDANGDKCPLHAHIRRANPRAGRVSEDGEQRSPTPQIMRRGFSYGPRYTEEKGTGEKGDRGIFFMAYNASIAQQFEVIQRWISGGNSTGVLSAQSDPLLGVAAPGHARHMRFVHNDTVMRFNLGEEPFVKLEWGMYLFVPSISSMEKLARYKVDAKPYPQANVERGKKLINKFRLLDSVEPASAILRWTKLLEDRSTRKFREDAWAYIRSENGGVLRTPYGVLVGSDKLVTQVLRDEGDTFSVREYFSRMQESIGVMHLGMDRNPQCMSSDPQPQASDADQWYGESGAKCVHALKTEGQENVSRYDKESKPINQWISAFAEDEAFKDAREQAENWLDEHLVRATGKAPEHGVIKLKSFVSDVLAQLSIQWFVIPNGKTRQIGGIPWEIPYCMDDFKMVASNIFSPNPTGFVKNQGEKRGKRLHDALKKYAENVTLDNDTPNDTLFAKLYRKDAEPADIARIVSGAVMGFVAPTTASFLSVMNTWIGTKDLWRYQQALVQQQETSNDASHTRARKVLKDGLVRAMQERPGPSLLHRTVVKNVKLGGEKIRPGERVVLGLVSATLQQLESSLQDDKEKTRVLFGGNYGDEASAATAHACPGQNMAFGVLLGIVSMLLERGGTLRHKGGFDLSLNEKDDLTVG